MSDPRQWLQLGLDALPPAEAARIHLFRAVIAGAAMLRSRLDREMADTGVTTQQAAMLQCIEAQGEPPTIGAVALAMAMTHQNVKQIALALERKGFLKIEIDAQDRRARRLVTTAKHRRFWARRNPADFVQVQAWTAGLNDTEVAAAARLLDKFIAGMVQAPGPSEPAPIPTVEARAPGRRRAV